MGRRCNLSHKKGVGRRYSLIKRGLGGANSAIKKEGGGAPQPQNKGVCRGGVQLSIAHSHRQNEGAGAGKES